MTRSSNRGVIAVVGGGCIAGLAFALGYLFYWAPKQKAEQAQQEIKQWSEAWHEARACFLGEIPLADEPGLALTARLLVNKGPAPTYARCIKTLKALRRGEGYNTEDEDIEAAWHDIQIPVSKLAQAQAWMSAKEPNNPPDILREKLGAAIVEVDKVHNSLRKAAGLSEEKIEGPALAKSEVQMVLGGPDDASYDISLVRVEADAITYLATGDDSQYRARLSQAGQTFERLSPLALRAVQADWGMWVELDGVPMPAVQGSAGAKIMAGSLDSFGEPSGEGTLLHTLQGKERVTLSFAIGQDHRSVLFRIEESSDDYYSLSWRYQLMVSDDGGAHYRSEPLPPGDLWVSLQASTIGNHISWQDKPESTSLNMLRLTTEGSEQELLNFSGDRSAIVHWPPELCQAPHRSWWVVDGIVYTMGTDARLIPIPGQITQDPSSYEQTMRCTDEGFSVSSQRYGEDYTGTLLYQACSLDRCDPNIHSVDLPLSARYQLVHHEGKWRALVMLDEMVATWTEGNDERPTQLASIQHSDNIYGALSWESGLLLIAWPDNQEAPSLMRLP